MGVRGAFSSLCQGWKGQLVGDTAEPLGASETAGGLDLLRDLLQQLLGEDSEPWVQVISEQLLR